MSNFSDELQIMEQGLILLKNKKESTKTYREWEKLEQLMEVQLAMIAAFKRSYKLALAEIKSQTMLP
jgi:hypothetical protein